MTELERVSDAEVVEDRPSWEELVSEFVEGSRFEIAGQLRQARAAATVCRHYGRSSIARFAGEVGKSPSWCYDLARVWIVYGHIFEEGGELSNRLETLGITHFVKTLSAPDPVALAEKAHDEGLTARQTEEEARGETKNAQLITHVVCPECGAMNPMSRVETREVPA